MDCAKARRGTRHSIAISLMPSRVTETMARTLLNSLARSSSDIAARSVVSGRKPCDIEYSRLIRSCAARDLAIPQMQGGRSMAGGTYRLLQFTGASWGLKRGIQRFSTVRSGTSQLAVTIVTRSIQARSVRCSNCESPQERRPPSRHANHCPV